MCGGVEAREADKIWRIYFPNPKAAFPVLLEDSGQRDWIICVGACGSDNLFQ